jgi:diguanylate cyclase (GGDEF)-like protein/PAS domain S-box-containing protein
MTAMLWYEHNSVKVESEEKIKHLAKDFSLKQQLMLQSVEHLTELLANQQKNNDPILATCSNYTFELNDLYSNIANIGIVDIDGNLLCATNSNSQNININDRPYFKNALQHKSLAISYFQFDRSLEKHTVNFAYPIFNNDNKVKGVVVTFLALDWWNNAFNEMNLPKNTLAYITDDKKRILASYPNQIDKVGQQLQNSDLAHDQKINTIVEDENGINRFLHYSTLYFDEQGNKLNFYVGLPVNAILLRVQYNLYKSIAVFLVFTALFIVFARRLISKSILNPIANLSSATIKLSKGIMPDDKIHNSPELNSLYQRFKMMAQTRLSAEANLKRQHAELHSLMDALPDTYLRIDAKGKILTASGQLTNINPTETVFTQLSTLISKKNSAAILANLPYPNSVIHTEFKCLNESTWHTYEARIITMQKDAEYMVVIRDVSQRKESEDALNLAALAYQNSSEGMTITDKDGVIYDVNPAFCKSTLYSREEIIGKSSSILASGKHNKHFYQEMWRSLEVTGRWQGEMINRKKDGSLYNEYLTIDTVYDENKKVISRIAIFTDLTEKKQANELIWRQAHFDHLTDLPNRLELKERLQTYFNTDTSSISQLVIMLLDVDHFKDINDTLGHHYGDNLLKEVSKRIVDAVEEAEFVARIGGDEFVIVLNKMADESSIRKIATRIVQSFANALHLKKEELYISVSVGIACAPTDGENTEQLLKAADQAMYKAKSNGRNRFEFFSADMREEAQARMLLLKDLRVAIEREQFELYFQPIVRLSDLSIEKAEGLIRWNHPEKGLISPASFISLTEETRQINALGQFVFNETLKILTEPNLPKNFQFSINVSPIQLATLESGIDEWPNLLKQAELPPSSIVAEITEGLMVNPEALTQERLKALVNSGMQLALDDFGTGYSSLAYLQEMDTDYLKIDKRFVDNIQQGSQELALCEAIIVMAHQLGLKVIAEGIETQLQMELLLNAGCDYGQGYLFAKPLPKKEFMNFITQNTQLKKLN